MKFFISGQINDLENVKGVMRQVVESGNEITHDWTDSDVLLGGANSKLDNITESASRANKDIQGVIESDVYVLCSDNEKIGKGMYVELGAAIALHETRGYPKVYVIGELNHLSLFYLHEAVKRKRNIQAVLEDF
jgi:hypothetical protein